MPATLMFYCPLNSEEKPEYSGAVFNEAPYVLHQQVQSKDDSSPNWRHWVIQDLSLEQFYHLSQTHHEEPRPVDQLELLKLLKIFILPLLPL